MKPTIPPTGHERVLGDKEIIVSKTDLTGKITYANKKFLEISGFCEEEVVGIQHNIIRHPDMPRVVFKFLWERLKRGEEVFAYVKNLCKSGDYYWVIAHVTPSISETGEVLGYHSNRRAVNPSIIETVIAPLYAKLTQYEASGGSPKQALEVSHNIFKSYIDEQGGNYDNWLFSL